MCCAAGDIVRCTCSSVTPLIWDADEQQTQFDKEGTNQDQKTTGLPLCQTSKHRNCSGSVLHSHISSAFSPGVISSASPERWLLLRSCLPKVRCGCCSCFFFFFFFFLLSKCSLPLMHEDSPVQSAAVGSRLSVLQSAPPIWNQSREQSRRWRAAQISAQALKPTAKRSLKVGTDGEPRGGKTSQLLRGEEVSVCVCSLFSRLIPRPPRRERDGPLGWTGWRNSLLD